jgi:hypothetical protein
VGQSANDASAPFGWTEGQKQIRVDREKFATLTSEGMLENLTEGSPMAERELALAVQGQSYEVDRRGMEDQAFMVRRLGKRLDATTRNGTVGGKEDGRGDDNSADMPYGHVAAAGCSRRGYRRCREKCADE